MSNKSESPPPLNEPSAFQSGNVDVYSTVGSSNSTNSHAQSICDNDVMFSSIYDDATSKLEDEPENNESTKIDNNETDLKKFRSTGRK